MYLKSITIQGFKSFANKTVLEFQEGITGIVGPNGSGKSNVADAVRWVLGEQSARQLRGGNMQDVIFSGTESRKPLGFASVSITFDNRDRVLPMDSEEITVARRLFRSGESEYLLNGRNCRLKDVHELFYDTGIGKEGYSIIGQGQIDKILSGKPDDRRELFDEAAGIVKFKRRKTASLRKLEDEEQNLVRVTDILKELNRQAGPLEEQSGKAEQYLRYREELKGADIALFQAESGQTRRKMAEISKSLEIAKGHQAEIEKAFEDTRREYDRIEGELEKMEEISRDFQGKASAARLKKNQGDGEIRLLEEQIRSSDRNNTMHQDRIQAIESETARKNADIESHEQEKAGLQQEMEKLRRGKEAGEQELEEVRGKIVKLSQSSEQSRTETIHLLNQRTSIKEKMQRYETMLEQIEIRKKEVEAGIQKAGQEQEKHQDLLKDLSGKYENLTGRIRDLEEKTKAADEKLDRIKQDLEEKTRQLGIGQQAFHRESSRLESLKNIAERYEGYGNSIKKVMSRKEENPGIHGVLADLIRTKAEYETAIETALGGNLRNIVTDNERTAKEMISYLKQGRYGRATFLPLTAVRAGKPFERREALREEGVIGIAASLVECDRIYRAITERLLGNTLVVDTIDHAIRIARKYHHSLRMVTKEGDLLNPGGSMTGGAYRSSSNLLGRQREIKELQKNVSMLQKEMRQMQEDADKSRESGDKIRKQRADMETELQKLYLEQNTAKIGLSNAREHAGDLAGGLQRLEKEKKELSGQIRDIRKSQDAVSGELADSESRESHLTSEVQQSMDELSGLRKQEEDLRAKYNQTLLEYNSRRQKYSFLENSIKGLQEESGRLRKEKEGILESISMESQTARKKQEQIRTLQREQEELDRSILGFERKMEEIRGKREELNAGHREFFEKRDALEAERRRMDQECFRLESQAEKAQETYDNLVGYLWEEYQMTPDEAFQKTAGSPESASSLRAKTAGLKKQIRSLGTVNVNAIGEYKELKTRRDFLQGQYDDLTKAAGSLHSIIRHLDEGMRRQFREKFGEIQKEFNRVFRELFGGGKGTLELVEEEDILTAGILINVQPPGKKLQNMMQLSGGEKALTAIALLFAIQNLKPSPFCLLDEIEAALDDSNVTRFAEYLGKLTKNIQFIIITHRRGTMVAADRLYGITMQEKGVSTLVSVDLVESELT